MQTVDSDSIPKNCNSPATWIA
uniref:Uncharacterized protein n=1 Tax=Arundo donax TaxID=35708 RepID=A0A0A9HM16_ARUDO